MRIQRRAPPPDAGDGLLDLPPLLRRLYLSRGVRHSSEVDPDLSRLLRPEPLSGLEQAVDLLEGALRRRERILVVGDYDADGATACALAVLVLRALGAAWTGFLTPNRFEFGYGLSPPLVDLAAGQRPDLLVTVDNGIASLAGVERANSLGMRVLVTDHHLPGDQLPAAAAILNPNLADDAFPSKHLAGVGVVFYLMSALRARLRAGGWFAAQQLVEPRLADYLDLVALGTVADVVPLDANNRVLVEQGLRRIRAGRCRPGILALLRVAGRDPERLAGADLGFVVAPRLNAAGRLEDMSQGVQCLLAEDPDQALALAQTLDDLNRERRRIEAEMGDQAQTLLTDLALDQEGLPRGLCLFDYRWHQGVIGILAARIRERWHRPVIALAEGEGDYLKGSARSVPDLHIRDALATLDARHPGLLERFGGHAMAAGLSLHRDRWQEFARAFDQEVRRRLGDQPPEAELISDGPLAASDLTLDQARLLRYAGPWGQGFPPPVFDDEFQVTSCRLLNGGHLRLQLSRADSPQTWDAMAFGWGERPLPQGRARLVYRLDLDQYRGQERARLIVEHLDDLE